MALSPVVNPAYLAQRAMPPATKDLQAYRLQPAAVKGLGVLWLATACR